MFGDPNLQLMVYMYELERRRKNNQREYYHRLDNKVFKF